MYRTQCTCFEFVETFFSFVRSLVGKCQNPHTSLFFELRVKLANLYIPKQKILIHTHRPTLHSFIDRIRKCHFNLITGHYSETVCVCVFSWNTHRERKSHNPKHSWMFDQMSYDIYIINDALYSTKLDDNDDADAIAFHWHPWMYCICFGIVWVWTLFFSTFILFGYLIQLCSWHDDWHKITWLTIKMHAMQLHTLLVFGGNLPTAYKHYTRMKLFLSKCWKLEPLNIKD